MANLRMKTTSGRSSRRRRPARPLMGLLGGAIVASTLVMAPASANQTQQANVASSAPQLSEEAREVATLPVCEGRNLAAFGVQDFLNLGLNRPVAERAASVAPDLRSVDHLRAVPGIGPGQLAAIAAAHPDLCAAPPVVPPPTKDSCVSATQHDLNRLAKLDARERLANGTSLSHEEVSRIAAAGPFASVRVALAFLGIGDGAYARLMRADPPSLCVTPPGFSTSGGAQYEWITSWLTDGLAAEGFGLAVAEGTLKEVDGAWAYINRQDIELQDGALPVLRADVHLLSDSWKTGGKTVWVTTPADHTPSPPGIAVRQTVWHELPDGTFEPFYGKRLYETADSLTVEVTSTSFFTTLFEFAWEGFRWIRGASVGSPTCSGTPPPAGSTHEGAFLSNSPGGLIGECTYGNENVPGAVGAIDRVRAEISVYFQSTGRVQITNPGAGDSFIASIVADVWESFGSRQVGSFGSNTNLYLPPEPAYWNGNTFVAPASYGTYEIAPATGPTMASLVMEVAYEFVIKKIDGYVQDLLVAQGVPRDILVRITTSALSTFVECGYGFYRADIPTDVRQLSDLTYSVFRTCVPSLFQNLLLDYVDELQDYLAESRLAAVINALRRSTVSFQFLENIALSATVHDEIWNSASKGVAVLVDLVRVASQAPVHALWAPAVKPTRLDSGQPVPAACVVGDGRGYTVQRNCVVPPAPPSGGPDSSTYIVNVSEDPLAFAVRGGVNVGEFASGGDYVCAAQSLLVRFVKDRSYTEAYGSSDARLSCPEDVGGGGRNIAAVDNVLLRMEDGTTFFKNSSTLVGIEHVLDGGCFEQLAADHFGYDYVSHEEVRSALQPGWEIDDASAACQ